MIVVPNSKKDVFLCTFDVNYDNGTYSTKALNSKNEEIFTNYEQIEAISNMDENQNLSYDDKVLRVKSAEKYGLINMEGNEILPCEYDQITALQGVENVLLVSKDDSYGIVDDDGRTLLPVEYAEIQALGDETTDGFIVKNIDGKYGVVNNSNEQVLEMSYDGISKLHQGDYYVVLDGENQKVVKKDGTESLDGNGSEIIAILKNPEDGVIYKEGEKYGVMNLTGESVIDATYDDLQEAKSEVFIAKTGENYGIIDLSGNTLVDFKYRGISYNEKADLYVTEDENYNNQILNSNYEVKLTGILTDLNDDEGYIEIRQDDEYKYYNFRFEEKKESDVFPSNTLFASKKDGKYGFVDKDGNIVVDYIYDDVGFQNAFGYAAIKKDGKWGAIDKTGKVVQDPIYDLEDYLQIDFIGSWYLGKDLNMNYYRK